MPEINKDVIRKALEDELASLQVEDEVGAEDLGTVHLDQQSVGRLSRMDAMQRQAMAQANQRRRTARKQRLFAALGRLEEGEYGYCTDCGEDVHPDRLALDPAVALCISCARG